MGRTTYEGMAASLPTADHPFSAILNAAPKVVFSRTLQSAGWANTTVAAGDTAQEVDKLTRGGDGHIMVWGGVRLWRSLMELDLIDEFRLDVHPYIAREELGCSRTCPSPTGSTSSGASRTATGS